MPKRIQRKRTKGWLMPENTVCVDRTTVFGNPFPIVKVTEVYMGQKRPRWCIGTWNGPGMWFKDTKEEAHDIAVKAYRVWISAPKQALLCEKVRCDLHGKNLACWCSEFLPCHGDVLLEMANEVTA